MVKNEGRGKRGAANDDDGFDQGGTTGRGRAVDHDPDAASIHNDPPTTYQTVSKRKVPEKKGKTVTDTKRGRAQDGYQVEVGGDEAGKGHNSQAFDGKALTEYFQTVTGKKASIKARAKQASLASQPDRKAITAATKAMVASGYPTKVLATKLREYTKKLELAAITENLDDEEKITFEKMSKALGGLADTPLGAHALSKTEGAPVH